MCVLLPECGDFFLTVGNGCALAATVPSMTESTGGQVVVPEPAPKRSSMPKWETETREAIKKAVRRYQKPLQDLVTRDANEGDTRLLVTDFLCDGLGYDKYEHLTTEYQVKGEFADYGVRIDKQLVAFIEVKRVAQKLNDRHLRQVQQYAVNEGVEWMILTNGQIWTAYHLTGGLPVVVDKAFEVDLLDPDSTVNAKADLMFYFSLEAMKRHLIDALWKERAATSPKNVAKTLLSEPVLEALRKTIRRDTGLNADIEKIAATLRLEVIRPELLLTNGK